MSSDPPSSFVKQEKPKFKVVQTFFIGLGFMSCMFAWSMYNFYLPRILAGHKVAEEILRVGFFQGNTSKLWTGVVMILDNIAAILLQPYFGDLSDRLESKLGRRTPFLIIGIPLAALSMFFMPFAIRISSFLALLIGFIGLVLTFNLGMAIYRAPVVALMPDLTPSTHRSMANVIINVMGGIGSVMGMYLPIIIGGIDSINEKVVNRTTFENQDYFAMDSGIFWSSAIIILIILVLYLLLVHEKPTGDTFWHVGNNAIKFDPDTLEIIPNTNETGRKEKYNVFKEFKLIRNASDKSTLYMFFSLFFWTMSTDVFGTFLSLWGPEYALLSDSILGSMSIITAVVLLALGYPAAIITKKKGRLWTMRLGSLCLIIAYGALIIFQELGRANFGSVALVGVIACIVLKTFGGSLIAISAITITWQLAPDYKVGTYTGLYYLFKQLGQVLSPILFGGIISIFTALLGETMAWIVFIPYCLIFSILFYWTFAKVKKGEVGDTWDPTTDVASKDDLETE